MFLLTTCLFVVASCLVMSSNGVRVGHKNTDNEYLLADRNNLLWKLDGGTNDNANADFVRDINFDQKLDNIKKPKRSYDTLSYLVQTVDRHNPDTLRELDQRVYRMLNNRQLQDQQTHNLAQKLYKVRLIGEEVNHHDWMNLRYNGEPNKFVRDMAKYL